MGIDAEIRALERRWRQSGAPEDLAALERRLAGILSPIPADDVPGAYGLHGPGAREVFEGTVELMRETGEGPDLDRAYQYQPNATGSGIVFTGHSEALEPLTEDLADREGIALLLRPREGPWSTIEVP